jgi:DNA-binding LytR/AlgR family response regulator
MKKIRCLLVDDEPPAIHILRSHISAVPAMEIVATCHNAVSAFSALQNYPVDLMFLDIRMPKLSGIDFLKSLRQPPAVIFTTAYREYALDGYDLDAVDYLLKPIPFDRFLRAVQKVYRFGPPEPSVSPLPENYHAEHERFLYFRVDRKMVKVLLRDIRYVESLKDYVRIVTGNKQLIVKQSISALEELLPEEDFIRIHRSFMVAVDQIEAFTPAHISIAGKELPLGRLYKHTVFQALKVQQ